MCLLFRRTFEIIERRSRIVSDLGDNNFAGKLWRLRNWSLNAKREKLNLFYGRATKEQRYMHVEYWWNTLHFSRKCLFRLKLCNRSSSNLTHPRTTHYLKRFQDGMKKTARKVINKREQSAHYKISKTIVRRKVWRHLVNGSYMGISICCIGLFVW